jgi:hypothetical protein
MCPGVAPMSLTIFLALCILSLDFMIYFLFKLFYGDHRSVIARRVAAQREAARAEAAGLIFVSAKKIATLRMEPNQSARVATSKARSRKSFTGNSDTKRIA